MLRAAGPDLLPLHPNAAPPRGEDARDAAHGVRVAPSPHVSNEPVDERFAVDLGIGLRPQVTIAADPPRKAAARSGRAIHGIGALAGSLFVHSAAGAAMLLLITTKHSEWVLPMNRGRDSVALSASVAAPPPSGDQLTTVDIPDPSPPTPMLPEPEPLDAEPLPPVAKQTAIQSERPSASFADLKEDRRQPPAPIAPNRAEVESPEAGEESLVAQPKRKSRPANQGLPRDSMVSLTPESVASAASAPDSGVVTDQPPAIMHIVQPIYPPESMAAREKGVVKLRIKVDRLGNVVEASLYRSSGFARLDQAALDVIHSQRFAPADGSTVGRAAEFVWPIEFRLRELPARR